MNDIRWTDRKSLKLLRTTREYPLGIVPRAVYSYLAWRSGFGGADTIETIGSFLGMDRRSSIPDALTDLEAEGLASKTDGRWDAVAPNGVTEAWFAWTMNVPKTEPWHRRLKFVAVYLPARDRLTFRDAVLYFGLRSLCFAAKSDVVLGQTKSGLAALISVSRATVRESLTACQKAGLLAVYGAVDGTDFAVRVCDPPDDFADWFRPAKERRASSLSDAERYPGLFADDSAKPVLRDAQESVIIDTTLVGTKTKTTTTETGNDHQERDGGNPLRPYSNQPNTTDIRIVRGFIEEDMRALGYPGTASEQLADSYGRPSRVLPELDELMKGIRKYNGDMPALNDWLEEYAKGLDGGRTTD